MNKKGSLLDPLYIVLILFTFAIISIIMYYVLSEFQIQSEDKLTSTYAQEALTKGEETLLNFDNLIVVVLVGLIIATLVGAYFIDTSPIIFWVSLFLLFTFVTVAVVFTNAFEEIIGTAPLNEVSSDFSIMSLIMSNLPLTLIIIFVLVGIVLYAKWRAI